VTNVEGIENLKLILAIYLIDKSVRRFKGEIKDGSVNSINVKINLPKESMQKIINGSEAVYIYFELLEKGFFSTSVLNE
jgi:hypothetical protein